MFPHTKNDYWQQIQTDENKTSCLYTLGANNVFTTHKHVFFDETVEVLTKGAKVEWVTEEGIFYYSYGDKFTVEKGIEHALVNLVNFPIDLKVDWKPKMIYGWEGNFKQIKTLKKE